MGNLLNSRIQLRRVVLTTLLVCIGLLFLTGCGKSRRVAAEVGGKKIYVDEVEKMVTVKDVTDFNGVGKVKFNEGENSIIEFDFDFDCATLSYHVTKLQKQAHGESGYILISGIPSSCIIGTKTIYVDNMLDKDEVCVIDKEIASIDEMSVACNGEDEFLLTCDAVEVDGYTCTKENSRYKITGLKNSGIKEYVEAADPNTGSGSNNGGGGGGGGGSGSSAPKVCTESWSCTAWTPTVCPIKRQQVRQCTDVNACGTETTKPNEIRTCYYYQAPEEDVDEVAEDDSEEESSSVAAVSAAPPEPPETLETTQTGMFGVTGAVIGNAYQMNTLPMVLISICIIGLLGLFVYL